MFVSGIVPHHQTLTIMSKYRLTPFAEAKLQEIKEGPQAEFHAKHFEHVILKGYDMTISDYSYITTFFDPLDPPYWTKLFTLEKQV